MRKHIGVIIISGCLMLASLFCTQVSGLSFRVVDPGKERSKIENRE